MSVCVLVISGCGGKPVSDHVRIWHWMTDRDDAFQQLAAQYLHETNIPVRFELYAPTDLYVQKVRAGAQTSGLPDVFGILGESRDFASFVKAGHILDLSEAMDADGSAWRARLFPIALAVNTFPRDNVFGAPSGVYGVPIDVMNLQLYYNKRLLSKLGLDPSHPPSTWEEWLSVGKLAHSQGLVGLVSGWSELWMIQSVASSYAIHLMGQERVEETYRGQRSYAEKGWQELLALFEQLRESGLPAEGIVTMGNKRAEQLFANEQAVFAFNGTWAVNIYKSMNPDLDYGVMMLPPVRAGRRMVTWGGAGSSFMVNAASPKRDQAVAFLRWMTDEPQQRFLMDATHNIPANIHVAAVLSGPLALFAQEMSSVVHPHLLAAQEQSPVTEAFAKGIQSILIGERSAAQVAEMVDQVKRHEQARRGSGEHSMLALRAGLRAQHAPEPNVQSPEPDDAVRAN